MRTINRSGQFKRDFRRERAGQHGKYLERELAAALEMLAADIPLPQRYVDHALVGRWKNFRDCHIRPDLILIYRKPDDTTLDLARLGSHSELGL